MAGAPSGQGGRTATDPAQGAATGAPAGAAAGAASGAAAGAALGAGPGAGRAAAQRDGGSDRARPSDRALAAIEHALARLLDLAAAARLPGLALVAAVALVFVLPGIAALPVTDRDEARFAQASKQMLETGDLVDIRFQDAPRWKKPVGIYWMQAGVASLAGGPEAPIWAYRVPSALGVVAAALLLGWAVRPLVGARAAALAALMLPATLLALAEANIAKTDAVLLACAVAALGALARMLPRDGPPERRGWGPALAFWTALGIAALVKGPIVPLIGLLALLWLWLIARRPVPRAALKPLPGLALAAAIVLPWLVAIWQVSGGAFFEESVGRDLLGKVKEGQETHWGPPGLYLVLVWATFWPWAALLPAALPWAWARRREAWLALLAGWVVPFWVLLEAVPTKLPHYVLPLYPALAAVIAAWALSREAGAAPRGARIAAAWLVAVPGLALCLALLVLPPVLEGRVLWAALPFAALGAGATLLAAAAARRGRPLAQIGVSLAASALIAGSVLELGLPALRTAFPSPRIAALAGPWEPCASGPLISAGYREPSLVFLAGTGTRLASPDETARALAEEPGALVLLEDRWMKFLERRWERRGETPPELVERGRLAYFNYNRGDMETARLLTRPGARWEACGG